MHAPTKWARISMYLSTQRWIMLGAVLCMGIVAGSEVMIPILMRPLLDQGFGGVKTGLLSALPNGLSGLTDIHLQLLWVVPIALVSLAVVRGAAQFFSSYLLNLASNNILLTLREQMFSRMLHASAAFFQKKSASALINTLVFEVNQILQILSSVLISLVRDSLTVIGMLGFMIYLNWHLTLIVAIVLPPIGWLMSFISKRLRRLGRAHQEMTNHLSYVVEEVSGGYKVVKIHGAQAYEQQRFNARARALRGYAMRMAVSGGLNQPITQLLATIALAIIIAMAMLTNTTSVGSFAAFITAMLLIVSPLKRLADINQPLQRGLIAAEMIVHLLDEPDEAQALPGKGAISLSRAQGALSFQQICFTYANNTDKPILDHINLTIKPGQVIALVGPSGGGKTTLVNLVPRFLVAQQGQILLDQIPIEDISLSDLRKQIAFVSQDVVLFNDTIAANVAYGVANPEEIDRTRVQTAIDAAYLREMVAALPNGLDTVIGDNGSQLSGGQRQRLAIARAIYKDAPILILDEATSALDSESERQVQKALIPLMQGRTTLVIAHRLSTIERADQIVVLDQGRIVQQGTHTQLLEEGGLYTNLHRLQVQSHAQDLTENKTIPRA